MAVLRAPKKIITLPPVREVEEIELALLRESARQRCTFSEIRRRAYRLFLFGDPFHVADSSVAVSADSVFPDSAFDQQSRVSPCDTSGGNA